MKADFKYDVIVIGAGHAGCEAAHAAATLGAETCLITMDMDKIAQMSCNPAIGGIAKGQIVREVDALGGLMGLVTDESSLQFRMLNLSKGPAMWSPRAQCDRTAYIRNMKRRLDATPRLHIWQDQVTELLTENNTVCGVRTQWGITFAARAVVVTAGTFLGGLMHVGRHTVEGGRSAEPAAKGLTESLTASGLRAGRMKTGTPVRIDRRSVHFEYMEVEPGDTGNHRFSYLSPSRRLPQMPCWTCYTNPDVHNVLRSGFNDSPLFNGQIQSIGPRYCPSIETKLAVFPDRDRHLLFLEPEGENSNEMYLNGFSSSLPMPIQLKALRQIPCFRDVEIYRPGYAIEYDFFDPTQLTHSLQSKLVDGLFLAGQVNGTTGYEEAAGQGLLAGVNAALKCGGSQPLILHRDEAYIGVLIDDLVTKGVDEPYRMFTSRAEYRILLRQDNADARLTAISSRIDLASEERQNTWKQKKQAIDKITSFCKNHSVKPSNINPLLTRLGSPTLQRGCKIAELLGRPELSLKNISDEIAPLRETLESAAVLSDEAAEAAEVELKYAGYITREQQQAEKLRRLEDIYIRPDFDYASRQALSTEARQKLTNIKPSSLGQASRIPGVSPADISALLVFLGR